jgi:hypothetical protein
MEVEPESGDIYYWNKVTGATQLHEPEMLEVEDDTIVEDPGAAMYNYQDLETAGWEVLFAADGSEYYLNPETGEETQYWPFEALYEGEGALPRPVIVHEEDASQQVVEDDDVHQTGFHNGEVMHNSDWEVDWQSGDGGEAVDGQVQTNEQDGSYSYFYEESETQSWEYPVVEELTPEIIVETIPTEENAIETPPPKANAATEKKKAKKSKKNKKKGG